MSAWPARCLPGLMPKGAKTDGNRMNEGELQDQPIRVLVVDDHDLFRTGMSSLLSSQPDIEVVAQASGGRMGVRLASELRPDVVLMDLQMPDLGGDLATREVLERNPAARVVVLTVLSGDRRCRLSTGGGCLRLPGKGHTDR